MPQAPRHRMDTPRSQGLNKGSLPLSMHRGVTPLKNGRMVSAGSHTRSSRARFLSKQPAGDNVAPILRLPTRPATKRTLLPPPLKSATPPQPRKLLAPKRKPPLALVPPPVRAPLSVVPPVLLETFEEKSARWAAATAERLATLASRVSSLPPPPVEFLPATPPPANFEPAALPHWLKKAMASQTPATPERVVTLSNATRERMFGKFTFKPTPVRGDLERIFVNPPWPRENIVEVQVPALKKVQNIPYRGVALHRLVMPHFEELIAAWEDAGLLSKILTWNGGYVPRFRRGQAEKRVLSSHSWGSAFDVNARWNPFRKPPAVQKTEGSVRELAVIAKKLGWVWGGDFRTPDGMHFEAGPELLGQQESNEEKVEADAPDAT